MLNALTSFESIMLQADYNFANENTLYVTGRLLRTLNFDKDKSTMDMLASKGIMVKEDDDLLVNLSSSERADYFHVKNMISKFDTNCDIELGIDDGRRLVKLNPANIVTLMLLVSCNNNEALDAIERVYSDGSRGLILSYYATNNLKDSLREGTYMSTSDFMQDGLIKAGFCLPHQIVNNIEYYLSSPFTRLRPNFIKYGIEGLSYNHIRNGVIDKIKILAREYSRINIAIPIEMLDCDVDDIWDNSNPANKYRKMMLKKSLDAPNDYKQIIDRDTLEKAYKACRISDINKELFELAYDNEISGNVIQKIICERFGVNISEGAIRVRLTRTKESLRTYFERFDK